MWGGVSFYAMSSVALGGGGGEDIPGKAASLCPDIGTGLTAGSRAGGGGGGGPISPQPSLLSCQGGQQLDSVTVLSRSCLCVLSLPMASIRYL